MVIDYFEVSFRLCTTVFIGCLIGLDRNLHGKPTGVKTLGLVALGASLVTMAGSGFIFSPGSFNSPEIGRVIQGIITGVGFLGAGVIIHDHQSERVHGLTTAASIWVTAALGIVCGLGAWQVAGIALLIVILLFLLGRPLEKKMHQKWMQKSKEERAEITKHEE